MDMADRFQLKRKCQDGDTNGLYMNTIKRPLYDLENEQNHNCVMSPENGWPPSLTGSDGTVDSFVLPSNNEIFVSNENGRQFCTTKMATMDDNVDIAVKSIPQDPFISSLQSCDVNGRLVNNVFLLDNEYSSVKKSLVKSQGCSECLAGKSGHIHHIGRWKLIDSPSGFCQL